MGESEATLNDEINDDEQQLIKLCLKKPKLWNWELSTSKSSSNIHFPTIQLYDEKGKKLLAEAKDAGVTASSKLSRSASVSRASSLRSVRKVGSFKFKVNKDSIEEIPSNPIITEPEEEKLKWEKSVSPVQNYSECGLQLRDANSKEFKKPIEKPRTKLYSRSSSNSRSSVSILERISELKRNSEDSDSDTENERGDKRAKYSYRQCSLGTIIVPKESFTNVRRRPKRNESGENRGERCFGIYKNYAFAFLRLFQLLDKLPMIFSRKV